MITTLTLIVWCLILLTLISMGIHLYGIRRDWWRSNGTYLSPTQHRERREQFLNNLPEGDRPIYAKWLDKRT